MTITKHQNETYQNKQTNKQTNNQASNHFPCLGLLSLKRNCFWYEVPFILHMAFHIKHTDRLTCQTSCRLLRQLYFVLFLRVLHAVFFVTLLFQPLSFYTLKTIYLFLLPFLKINSTHSLSGEGIFFLVPVLERLYYKSFITG